MAVAQAESIEKVNKAIAAGGESYFRYRQIEMLPQIAPAIADALAAGEAGHDLRRRERRRRQGATNQIASVIQTVLAAQLVSRGGMLGESGNGAPERESSSSAPAPVQGGSLPKPGIAAPPLPPLGKR